MKYNKKLRIAVDIVLILVAGVFLFFGVKEAIEKFDSMRVTDSQRFAHAYQSVDKDNRYEYIIEKKLGDISDGVVFVGNPNDSWSQVLAPVLTDMLDEYEVSSIFYHETDEETPKILVYEGKQKVAEFLKNDIIDEEYDGIPIEYYQDENHKTELRKLLKILK